VTGAHTRQNIPPECSVSEKVAVVVKSGALYTHTPVNACYPTSANALTEGVLS
jgi:hypothetical protein